MNNNYRAYHFGNFYLSSLQQGIQAAHAQTELFKDYANVPMGSIVWEWAKNPTMICLNGGNNQSLLDIVDFLHVDANPYPWSAFYEDEESLGGILTNVCIVLPEKIYNANSMFKEYYGRGFSNFTDLYTLCMTNWEYYNSVSTPTDEEHDARSEMYSYARKYGEFTDFELGLVDLISSKKLAT